MKNKLLVFLVVVLAVAFLFQILAITQPDEALAQTQEQELSENCYSICTEWDYDEMGFDICVHWEWQCFSVPAGAGYTPPAL